jgi:hypothetical protein
MRCQKFPRRHSLNGPVTPRIAPHSLIRQAGPKMGFWVADPTKATAYIGPSGKLMLIQPARRSNRNGNTAALVDTSSSQQSLYELLNDSEQETASPTSPMLSTDVNLMMSGLFNGGGGSGQIMGPPEAFFPFQNFQTQSGVADTTEDDDDSEDVVIDVADFIDFGNGPSDEGDEEDTATDANGNSNALTKKANSQPLLNHLDGTNVTAFRRNTNRVHAYLKLPKHREFLPFSPPGTSSAVRSGRQSELYAPIAPPRKRKRDNSNPTVESSRGNTVQRKLVNTHKRTKSAV